ncbi:PaaI family thioesterase [Sulfurospirillum sp. 1307]|jgi:acyl-coenzyme A thioesterase PaaI-like protein
MAENEEQTQEEQGLVEEDFSHEFEDEEEVALVEVDENKENLKTHNKINSSLCGTIISLDSGYAKTTLQTTKEMIVDELGLIHSGFIFGAADFAAAASVNEENIVIIGAKTKFMAPTKLGDLITFEARAKFEDARKREIKVIAHINEIKVFEGIFQAIVLEQHIFKTNIKNAHRSFQ